METHMSVLLFLYTMDLGIELKCDFYYMTKGD